MFVGGEGVSHEGLVIAAVGDSSRRRGVVGAMKPALTREEWAKVLGRPFPFREELWHLCFGMAEDPEGRRDIRHAHAAVALEGQPFGFTREHVELLEGVATLLGFQAMDLEAAGKPWEYERRKQAELHELQELIEALLPPEGEDED